MNQFVGRAILFGSVILLQTVLFPPLFSLNVALGCAAFLLLVARKPDLLSQLEASPALSSARIAAFLLLHLALLGAAWRYMPADEAASMDASLGGFLAPGLRLAVLLPGLILFPLPTWNKLARVYSAEAVASLVVLFTFFPYRIVVFLWEHLGADALAAAVHASLIPFFHDAFYLLGDQPILGTLRFPVMLVYDCSGIEGIFLFQALFGLLVLWDWKRLILRRALVLYLIGLATMQAANLLRITSFIAVGTLFQEGAVAETYHINAGWIFFTATFVGFISLTYRWMLSCSRTQLAPAPSASAINPASYPLPNVSTPLF